MAPACGGRGLPIGCHAWDQLPYPHPHHASGEDEPCGHSVVSLIAPASTPALAFSALNPLCSGTRRILQINFPPGLDVFLSRSASLRYDSVLRGFSCGDHEYGSKMAMATAVASTSFTSLKKNTVFGAGVQGLRAANQKVSVARPVAVPFAKLSTSSDGVAQQIAVGANTLAGAMFAAMATSESALASQQIMALAEGDNRVVALLIPLVPAIGWVLFNILKPALNQVDKMRSAKALVAGAGLGSLAMLAAPHADAAQEIAQVAESDARGLIIIGLLLPAIGWVLFNILRPALNQFEKMQNQGNTGASSSRKRGVVGALGLGGASMLLAPHADAAQEIANLADSDSRGLIIIGLLLPAIGWVLFNILRPALNQVNQIIEGNDVKTPTKGGKRFKSVIGATGISLAASSLLAAPEADAQVQEIAQLGADTRPLILLFILAPAIGWVLYNILKPALNQVNKMVEGNDTNTPKGGRRK
ncbi:uncharacterized protein [Physcomitrium patens]|uniref:Uncharacterized protein n=2 Tax=Physcomitrium patens TaxID=3218 RepID=A0A7I4EEG0_PHYPA|nr:uncharacterized protein LOC112285917 isoform X1 [Physcomitrium patens]|eukprot:XP_024383068.1 uncharacterized protein LOC112285917 isoform X1 [Physcomitrella patens]